MFERVKLRIFERFQWGVFALGWNLTEQADPADVRALIRRLRPQDCGIDLIRVGGNRDGGYLIPNDLEGMEYCFSPGVSDVSDFENHLADLHIKSFLADYSVDSPPVTRPEIVFEKKFLGCTDQDPYITLASWKDKYLKDYSGDLLLQMDIEGFEIDVLLNAPDKLLDQFRIMVIEFHDMERLFDPFAFPLFQSCFDKLIEFFHVVHIHPNNYHKSVKKKGIEVPSTMEFTFLNKRRVKSTRPQLVFPHKLDVDNTGNKPLHLPKCWYCAD
jgi:hypothetical protein